MASSWLSYMPWCVDEVEVTHGLPIVNANGVGPVTRHALIEVFRTVKTKERLFGTEPDGGMDPKDYKIDLDEPLGFIWALRLLGPAGEDVIDPAEWHSLRMRWAAHEEMDDIDKVLVAKALTAYIKTLRAPPAEHDPAPPTEAESDEAANLAAAFFGEGAVTLPHDWADKVLAADDGPEPEPVLLAVTNCRDCGVLLEDPPKYGVLCGHCIPF